MIRLTISPGNYPEDVARIVRACAEAGYEVDPGAACHAWGLYSGAEYCAGWIGIASDAECVKACRRYLFAEPARPEEER